MHMIFNVWHFKIGPNVEPDMEDEWQDPKFLGEYTTEEKAKTAIERRKDEEGFRDWPLGFRITPKPIDVGYEASAAPKLERLHTLWHFRIGRDEEDDPDVPEQMAQQLGTYSTEENAKAEIERLRHEPAFRDWPDGFRIFSGPPNIDYWAGGFVPWDEA